MNSDKLSFFGRARYLDIFLISYVMIFTFSNWFDSRIIKIFGLVTGSGAVIFPFTYLLSDLITEVYGYKNARFAVWISLLFSFIFIIYGWLVNAISPHLNKTDEIFDLFLSINARIFLVSIVCFLLTEQLNSYLVAKLKILFSGSLVGFRFIISIMLAHFINAIIFCVGAFYGSMSNDDLLFFIKNSWLIMVSIELAAIPLAVRLSKKMKKLEKMDIYDRNTNFNLFLLDKKYADKDNNYFVNN